MKTLASNTRGNRNESKNPVSMPHRSTYSPPLTTYKKRQELYYIYVFSSSVLSNMQIATDPITSSTRWDGFLEPRARGNFWLRVGTILGTQQNRNYLMQPVSSQSVTRLYYGDVADLRLWMSLVVFFSLKHGHLHQILRWVKA